jgi:hypothetical protein
MSELITTAAELDALPVRSVVIWPRSGQVWQKWGAVGGSEWFAGRAQANSSEFVALHPTRVLYRPDEPARTLPSEGCSCTGYSEDRGGGCFEYMVEYDPACPTHSEHVWNPRTQTWELPGRTEAAVKAEALRQAADELTPVYAIEGAAASHLRAIADRYDAEAGGRP